MMRLSPYQHRQLQQTVALAKAAFTKSMDSDRRILEEQAYQERQSQNAAAYRANHPEKFSEAKHPRYPKGSPKGGEFAPKAGGGESSSDRLYAMLQAQRQPGDPPLHKTGVLGKRLKVVTGHRWLHEVDHEGEPVGEVLRSGVPDHPKTPYVGSPTFMVYTRKGQPVIVAETAHRRREIFPITLG